MDFRCLIPSDETWLRAGGGLGGRVVYRVRRPPGGTPVNAAPAGSGGTDFVGVAARVRAAVPAKLGGPLILKDRLPRMPH